MKKIILASMLTACLQAQKLRDSPDCTYVQQKCPVWKGACAICHVSQPICNGPTCYIHMCISCQSNPFGRSTNLQAKVNGTIQRVITLNSYSCYEPQVVDGGSTVKVHCAGPGGGTFHGNYDVYYISQNSGQGKSTQVVEQVVRIQ